MEKRNILLVLLAISFSLVVLRACELNKSGDHPHQPHREYEERVEQRHEMPPPPPPPAEAPAPPHKVVGEDLYDGPDQAKVEQIVVTDEGASRDELHALLYAQYAKLVEQAGFQYFEAPTDATIFIYESRQAAANQTDDWVARLRMERGKDPDVEIRR